MELFRALVRNGLKYQFLSIVNDDQNIGLGEFYEICLIIAIIAYRST